MKKLYETLRLFLGCDVGVFVGRCIVQYWDFKAHPDLYAMRSVPWYQPLKVQGIVTAGIAAIVLAAMWLVRKKINKKG